MINIATLQFLSCRTLSVIATLTCTQKEDDSLNYIRIFNPYVECFMTCNIEVIFILQLKSETIYIYIKYFLVQRTMVQYVTIFQHTLLNFPIISNDIIWFCDK